ncbi:hypothetical protein BKA66DRAFT_93762 [Pyrenochaeta sp. MPI-SDFR-AT-0127]|nr:hypothetical protein BKA66DRAFT_93762 [Pyrenochaeta sp. MPI-SDFR-AT-0127]
MQLYGLGGEGALVLKLPHISHVFEIPQCHHTLLHCLSFGMSIFDLPKEIRLHIWTHVYFSQAPRLVTLATSPHDENHTEDTFCPRYSPTPAPTAVNICHESRAEAHYQAIKAGHIVKLPYEHESTCSQEFYFRFDTDILYLQLAGARIKHFDDSPEIGLLAHFRHATGCAPASLQKIAITKVLLYGQFDGSVSNVLREFPSISHMIMMVPESIRDNSPEKTAFVHAARRIVMMYRFDLEHRAGNIGEQFNPYPFLVDFATLGSENELRIVPRKIWREWSVEGDGWATLDGPVPFVHMWD